jgi:hypothetical protein
MWKVESIKLAESEIVGHLNGRSVSLINPLRHIIPLSKPNMLTFRQ